MADIDERKNVIALLRAYRTLPALWDIKHEDYSNHWKKQLQYDILLKKYRETNPNAYMKELKRKINTVRTNFRREVRRLEKAALEGRPETSNLYYFEELSFLNGIKTTHPNKTIVQDFKNSNSKGRKSSSKGNMIISSSFESLPKNQVLIPQEADSFDQILPNTDIEIEETELKLDLDALSQEATICDQSLPKRDHESSQLDVKPDIYQQSLLVGNCNQESSRIAKETNHLPIENCGQMQDICQELCSLWYKKLTIMGNNQRIFAEKLINDVLFNGELGLLNFNTNIASLSPYQSLPIAKEKK